MADVMYGVVKVLEPLKPEERAASLAKLREEYLAEGDIASVEPLLNEQIERLKKEKERLKEKLVVDALSNLQKNPPRYARSLLRAERLWGKPASAWVGTEHHKDIVAQVGREISVERFAMEITLEFLTYPVEPTVTESIKESFIREMVPLLVSALDWTRASCPVFSLTDDFFHALAVTDFGSSEDDKEDILHMPFPAFVVNFPPNSLLNDTRKMLVHRVPSHDEKIPGLAGITWPATRLVLATDEVNSPFEQWFNGTSRWDFFQQDEQFKRQFPDASPLLSTARRILANMLSYIEASHGLPERKHLHGAPAAPVEREHTEPRFRVGRPVKLSPQIRQVLKEGRLGKSWKLGQRFIVRGHWRNQVHGPKRSLRRRQWIEPFWKGPASLTEALERSYSVE